MIETQYLRPGPHDHWYISRGRGSAL